MNKKIIPINPRKHSFEEIEHANAEVTKIFPGFSKRINELIDMSSLDIPKDWGRQMALAAIVNTSKMAAGHWLKGDRPPKASTLRNIVIFLTDHIEKKVNPLKVEAWLKYGEPTIQSPFRDKPIDEVDLSPVALGEIVSICKEKDVNISSFDLQKVLDATISTLETFEIYSNNEMEEKHKEIIYQYIMLNRQ